jgi:hypothetical protein
MKKLTLCIQRGRLGVCGDRMFIADAVLTPAEIAGVFLKSHEQDRMQVAAYVATIVNDALRHYDVTMANWDRQEMVLTSCRRAWEKRQKTPAPLEFVLSMTKKYGAHASEYMLDAERFLNVFEREYPEIAKLIKDTGLHYEGSFVWLLADIYNGMMQHKAAA